MKFVPLGPDAKLEKLATVISAAAVLVLTAVIVPLARFQLGDKGWRLLQESAGTPFWPLAAVAALGACLLLAYALGLHRRPRLGLGLVILPAGLAMAGAALGTYDAQVAEALPARGGDVVLARLAASLAAPIWALLLASGLAAAGGVVLGARELARARTLSLPWTPLLAALATITVVNTWSSYANLPPRPLISLLVAAALLGPLLAIAAWDQEEPPEAEPGGGATLILCLVLAVGATLAAVGAEALLFRSAALYAQGPGAEAHHHAMTLGGARGTTIRMISGAVALLGTLLTITVAFGPIRDQLRPPTGRSVPLVVVTLILFALATLGAAVHRHSLSQTITRANRRPAATEKIRPLPRPAKKLRN
jgi:hypothetical protein